MCGHKFNKYLLCDYHTNTVLGTGDRAVNKTDKTLGPQEACIPGKTQRVNILGFGMDGIAIWSE